MQNASVTLPTEDGPHANPSILPLADPDTDGAAYLMECTAIAIVDRAGGVDKLDTTDPENATFLALYIELFGNGATILKAPCSECGQDQALAHSTPCIFHAAHMAYEDAIERDASPVRSPASEAEIDRRWNTMLDAMATLGISR